LHDTGEQVLEHYGVLDTFKRTGTRLSGPCPIHGGSNPSQFRVDTEKNLWNCFSECKHGGNVLDFIAKKEDVSMGSTMTAAQEELIRRNTNANSHVVVMFDEDEAGKAGRDDIAARLSRFCFVKVHVFDKPDMQPEHMTAEEVKELFL
jgi:DNA primase